MSLRQSASTGVVCRGRWLVFFRAAGQRAVRGSLVSAGLGPRVVLCGAHDSLRLVLAGREVAWGGHVVVAGSFFGAAGQRAVRE